MAENKTRFGRKAVLDHFLGRVSHTFPTNRYLALFTADPTELGTLTNECTGGAYARVEISDKLGNADLTTGVISNTVAIQYATAVGDWPEITHLGVMDVITIGAGNMIYFGPAVTARTVTNGDTYLIQIGQLIIQEQ